MERERETEREPGYASAEVVLVSADIEEPESSYVAPEFEAVHEVEQTFAASFEVELPSERTVEIPIPEATGPRTVSAEGHTFAPPGDEAVAAEDDDEAECEDDADESHAPGAGTGSPAEVGPPGTGAADDPNRPRRRRRRRGGRGRGKPPDTRQSSE